MTLCCRLYFLIPCTLSYHKIHSITPSVSLSLIVESQKPPSISRPCNPPQAQSLPIARSTPKSLERLSDRLQQNTVTSMRAIRVQSRALKKPAFNVCTRLPLEVVPTQNTYYLRRVPFLVAPTTERRARRFLQLSTANEQ